MHHSPQPISISPDWKLELSRSITTIDKLLNCVNLDRTQLSASQQAAADFPLRVPQPFVDRMQPGNPNDPLLMQVLPVSAELESVQGYTPDPLEEASSNPLAGIVHKYANRLLLVVSPTCAINCRYCFRRHFPYDENRQSKQQWQIALDYIRNHSEINEVIYSGGDPLAANDHFLGWLTEQIAKIPHIRRLRIHTRLPVVIPSRIDQAFLSWATATRLKPIVVLHINHSNEIDTQLADSIRRLQDCGIRVLNQTVLLRGINDSADSLAKLSESLFDCDVMPYYLHLLDPVAGASHFDLHENHAKTVYKELQAILPGFLVPRLVREIPDKPCKTIIAP